MDPVTRTRASRRGFGTVELELADIAATPLKDAHADLYLLYNVLHVVSDPEAAVAEPARCLKPGGRLVGSMLLRGEVRRGDRFFARERNG